jgi:hypothetical protein
VEAFHGTLRRECLSEHWFLDLEDAKRTLEAWKEGYNNHRPHSALGQLPPAHFRAGSGSEILTRSGPQSGGTLLAQILTVPLVSFAGVRSTRLRRSWPQFCYRLSD